MLTDDMGFMALKEGLAMLKLKELKKLPFTTLAKMAHAVACDIDRGEDKRDLLERIFNAIRYRV